MVVMPGMEAGSVLTQTAGDEQLPGRAEPSAPKSGETEKRQRCSGVSCCDPRWRWQISSVCGFLSNILPLLTYVILIDWTLLWCNSLLQRKAVPDTKRKKQP